MTYNDYLIKITETIKIRSVNYRLSQNDIIYMTNNVYTEIAIDLNMDPFEQSVTMDKDVFEYDLDALYTPVGNEILLDTYKILDTQGIDRGSFFNSPSKNVFVVKEGQQECFMEEYDEDDIVFYRNQIPDIEALDNKVQILLFEAIINGIMYYTHSAIPSPVQSNVPFNETGMYYKLYRESIDRLRNQFPQV